MNDGSLTMTYSAVVTGKDQKKMVKVTFERPAAVETSTGMKSKASDLGNGKKVSAPRPEIAIDRAEAILPDCKITKQSGFTADEISQLEQYLLQNKDDIISKAKVISNPLNWL